MNTDNLITLHIDFITYYVLDDFRDYTLTNRSQLLTPNLYSVFSGIKRLGRLFLRFPGDNKMLFLGFAVIMPSFMLMGTVE